VGTVKADRPLIVWHDGQADFPATELSQPFHERGDQGAAYALAPTVLINDQLFNKNRVASVIEIGADRIAELSLHLSIALGEQDFVVDSSQIRQYIIRRNRTIGTKLPDQAHDDIRIFSLCFSDEDIRENL
jgi:hypothetical protein